MKAFKAEIKPVSYKNKTAILATVQLICLMRIKTGGPKVFMPTRSTEIQSLTNVGIKFALNR